MDRYGLATLWNQTRVREPCQGIKDVGEIMLGHTRWCAALSKPISLIELHEPWYI